MNFGLGPFRFTVPTFSIDEISEKVGGRVAHVEVMGSAPITQLLGPDVETLDFQSTYFPLNMNRSGDGLLSALKAAAQLQTPYAFMAVRGLVGQPLGRWIITSVENGRKMFAPNGRAQIVTASISLTKYVAQGTGGSRIGFSL